MPGQIADWQHICLMKNSIVNVDVLCTNTVEISILRVSLLVSWIGSDCGLASLSMTVMFCTRAGTHVRYSFSLLFTAHASLESTVRRRVSFDTLCLSCSVSPQYIYGA